MSALYSQTGGSTNFAFLNLISSSRVAATGGNLIAVDDADITMTMYNPSLLNPIHHKNLGFSYVNYFGDINFAYAGFGWNVDSVATFGTTIHYLNYGNFEERTETGEKTGDFKAADYVLTFGAGRAIDTSFSVGANLKMAYSSYYIVDAFAIAADLSASYKKLKRGIVLSAVMKNIGVVANSYTDSETDKLPFEVQLAISKKLKHAPFRFHFAMENLQKWDLTYIDPTFKPVVDPVTGETEEIKPPGFIDKFFSHAVIGTELITRNFVLGLGYNHKRRQELRYSQRGGLTAFSVGLGIRIKKIQFGYSLASYHLAGTSHNMSISLNLRDL